jgi:hypothetical protein
MDMHGHRLPPYRRVICQGVGWYTLHILHCCFFLPFSLSLSTPHSTTVSFGLHSLHSISSTCSFLQEMLHTRQLTNANATLCKYSMSQPPFFHTFYKRGQTKGRTKGRVVSKFPPLAGWIENSIHPRISFTVWSQRDPRIPRISCTALRVYPTYLTYIPYQC